MNTDQLEQQLTPTTKLPTEEGWYRFEYAPERKLPDKFLQVTSIEPRVLIRTTGISWPLKLIHRAGTWTGPIDLAELVEVVRENKRLTAELSTMSKLLLKASIKFQAVGDLFTENNSPTVGDYYRALAKECEQAATAEKGE